MPEHFDIETRQATDGTWRVVVIRVTSAAQRETELPIPFVSQAWAESAARGLASAYELDMRERGC